ncbi:aromatic ring-hydroxylating oxygenase subunit alpha [Sphingomonas sp. Leaf357]|uniref:aromatic ring-hydroxylating oxygenase subunit alpha n=1 Tax=Sphingomonas sp. Leaf357 TaxID=1736350 RepID=UPI001443BB83|nr:aromatic ring-hydroxylating dioxygenase subunit alpha [Sphingomonas sp. Leaf357]
MTDLATLTSLLARQRPDWSLEQPFYIDPDIYAFEENEWIARQWTVVGHISEVPAKGSYIVRELYGQSIIVVRASDTDVHAYYNVCTHRGSRLCKTDGRAPFLVCPYHAWSFRLTGELQSRQDVPEGVDPAKLGLHAVPVRVVEGLIFCVPAGKDLPDIEPAIAGLTPMLRRHGLARARIVARKSYPTNANWKLVVENAYECYHCRPAHPEYFSANGHVSVSAVRDDRKAAAWHENVALWREEVSADGSFNARVDADGGLARVPYRINRWPIGSGRLSLSRDGKPVAALMGDYAVFDGGETQVRLGRLAFVSAANDYATLVQIVPLGPEQTNMILTWLVDEEADPETIDVDAVSWMWDVTTVQDKRIVEDNAAGVRSVAYRPGPYTLLESETALFVKTYLAEMAQLVAGASDRSRPTRPPRDEQGMPETIVTAPLST